MKLQAIHYAIIILAAYVFFSACKEGYKYKMFKDMKVADNKIGDSRTGMNIKTCKKACGDDKDCRGFVMKADGTTCNLKSKGSPLKKDKGKVFYRKMTEKRMAKMA